MKNLKPIWVLFDGSPKAVRALTLAIELSTSEAIDLMLVLPAVNPAQVSELQRQVAELIVQLNTKSKIKYVVIAESELNQLLRMIRRQGCSLLFLHRDSPLLADAGNSRAIESVGCPIVLTR